MLRLHLQTQYIILQSKQLYNERISEAYNSYYEDLCFYANSFIRNFETSRDIVQDVFIKIFSEEKLSSQNENLKSYLYTSVRNASLNHLSSLQVRDKYKNMLLLKLNSYMEKHSLEIEYKDITKIIDSTLNQFPEQVKLIFDLSRNENLKYSEIANQLGISVKTVEAKISKVLKALRLSLRDYLPSASLVYLFL